LPKETEDKLQVALNQGGGEQVAQAQAAAEAQAAPATQTTPDTTATSPAL
jgi:hypothetical protein